MDKDGKLQMMENYPHGLLAIPSDGYSEQRILVPVDEQKARLRRLDPVRGVKFVDASTLMANAAADYMAAFDALKAAASAVRPLSE